MPKKQVEDTSPDDDSFYEAPEGGESVTDDSAPDAEATPTTEVADGQDGPAPEPTWYERLREQGLNLPDDADENKALETLTGYLGQAAGYYQQSQEQAEQIRWYHHQLQQLQAQQQALAAQQVKPVEPAKPKTEWKAPEFDPQWIGYLTTDDAGNIVAKPGADPTLPAKFTAWKKWKDEQEHKFWTNPFEFIKGGLQDYIQEQVAQAKEQSVSTFRQEQMGNEIVNSNAHWLFKDPQTRRQLSASGQATVSYAQALIAKGCDPATAFEYAKERTVADLLRIAQGTKSDADGAQATTNKQYVTQAAQRATRKPSQTGTRPRPEFNNLPSNGQRRDFKEMLAERFRTGGIQDNDILVEG